MLLSFIFCYKFHGVIEISHGLPCAVVGWIPFPFYQILGFWAMSDMSNAFRKNHFHFVFRLALDDFRWGSRIIPLRESFRWIMVPTKLRNVKDGVCPGAWSVIEERFLRAPWMNEANAALPIVELDHSQKTPPLDVAYWPV